MIVKALCLLLLCTPSLAQKTAIGKPAPDYARLEWVRPAALPPHAFDSSIVILEFWATWCAPCIKHMPAAMELEARYREKGVKVVAVSWDARPTQIDSFVREHAVPHYVCIDRDNTMFLKQYNERGIPYAIMFGRDGRAVWEGTADSLTPTVIDTYLATNTVPADPSEEERMVFSLSVQRSLPSDKNGIGTNYPINSELEIDQSIPAGLIVRTAQFLGLMHAKIDMSDDLPLGFYNLRLRIEPRSYGAAMRDRCLGIIDDACGTRTTIQFHPRMVYTVEPSSNQGTRTETQQADSTGKVMMLYSAMEQLNKAYAIEMVADDRGVQAQKIRFPSSTNSLDEGIAHLERCGYTVRKEERSLPTIVIRRAGE